MSNIMEHYGELAGHASLNLCFVGKHPPMKPFTRLGKRAADSRPVGQALVAPNLRPNTVTTYRYALAPIVAQLGDQRLSRVTSRARVGAFATLRSRHRSWTQGVRSMSWCPTRLRNTKSASRTHVMRRESLARKYQMSRPAGSFCPRSLLNRKLGIVGFSRSFLRAASTRLRSWSRSPL
jgi:hypothetical protein